MKHLSVTEIAKKWNISERSVRNYCAHGRVDGAFLIGKTWRIPENAEKPERSNKKKEQPITLLDILQEQKASKYSGGIYHKTQIDLTYNSNHMEGSRLTYDQTRYIFETKDLVIGYDEPLSKPLSLSMERGQKIALVGANGIGKTTLLKSILGLIPAISGTCELGENLQIGYFEQEVKGDNRTTCIEEIWQEFPSFTQYEVRSALAKCGLTTKHIESQVRVLSGGEQAKVRLCKLVNRDTNILLLDEPTNHLDVDAKDSLKKALLDYRGSVLLICHEPEFYQDVVHAVWDCSKWTTKQI